MLAIGGRNIVYFGQAVGGVYCVNKSTPKQELPILYSDAATSCLICFISGEVRNENTICYAHVDSTEGLFDYFERTFDTFGNENRVNFHAVGAVDYTIPNTSKNCGKELFDSLQQVLEECNLTDLPDSTKGLWMNYHTSDLVFQKESIFKHYYGFDTAEMKPVDNHISLPKETYLDIFGPQCISFYMNRPNYWMDNSFKMQFQVSEIRFKSILYAVSKFSTDEDVCRSHSTTPLLEPEEYFINCRTQINWAKKILGL